MAHKDIAQWRQHVTAMKNAIDSAPQPELETAAIFVAFEAVKTTDYQLYVALSLTPDQSIAAARAGALPWWSVFTARAFQGDEEGLRKVYNALPEAERKTLPTTAYKWIAEPYVAGDINNVTTVPVLRQLMKWGVNVNEDDAKWLEKSLRSLDPDHIRVLIDNGAQPVVVFRVMNELLANKGDAQAGHIQQALARDTFFMRIDDETLLQSKYIPGEDGGTHFKALFNFRARRVNEVWEPVSSKRPPVMTGASFDDYDAAAIEIAENRLRKLGGNPPDRLGKSPKAVLKAR